VIDLVELTLELFDLLARREYDAFVARCASSRLSARDIADAIDEYGRTVVSAPRDSYTGISIVRVSVATTPTWHITAPLWTQEEGRSDLCVELTVSLVDDEPRIELDNLLVP
jgi:hypothetical protein